MASHCIVWAASRAKASPSSTHLTQTTPMVSQPPRARTLLLGGVVSAWWDVPSERRPRACGLADAARKSQNSFQKGIDVHELLTKWTCTTNADAVCPVYGGPCKGLACAAACSAPPQAAPAFRFGL